MEKSNDVNVTYSFKNIKNGIYLRIYYIPMEINYAVNICFLTSSMFAHILYQN
uniref:Uncharacterized protein n=1 Tax=Anguilla anguilla TaxID=7936 RepID=A0A0E9V6P2_ANGAN